MQQYTDEREGTADTVHDIKIKIYQLLLRKCVW